MENQDYGFPQAVSQSTQSVRTTFIQKTYLNLAGAILAFVGVCTILLHLPFTDSLVRAMIGTQFSWIIVMILFMVVSSVADRWARSSTSRSTQYLGLGVFIIAKAFVTIPLLYIALHHYPSENLIGQAGVITLALFGALTLIAFTTKKDFSFLGGILKVASFVALGTIIASFIFPFTLGIFFCSAMVLIAGGSILYSTSNIIHHYREDQYVAASLSLFASIALLFWYILQILMSLASSD